MKGPLLVIGARPGSLGDAVVRRAQDEGFLVSTAGVSGEDYPLDVTSVNRASIRTALREVQPRSIVCTVGINEPLTSGHDEFDFEAWMENHFSVNVVGPMRILREWRYFPKATMIPTWEKPYHFAVISSNSAVIPRTNSMAYCASKAALSMAVRVAAREAANNGYIVYGYEPGWLAGTPMSDAVQRRFSGHAVPGMHRMREDALAHGVPVDDLAHQIVAGLAAPGYALNGALIRYDGGEL